MAARAKKKILVKRFAHAISVSVHYRDFEHAYVNWIWLRDSASYVIICVKGMSVYLDKGQMASKHKKRHLQTLQNK